MLPRTAKARLGGLLLVTALAAAARGDDTTPGPVQRLANGLRVVVQTIPDAAFVHVYVYYGAGSGRDPEGREGLAHLVEHLLFTSSQGYPDGGLARSLSLRAVTENAATSHVFLRTQSVCLPHFLPEILALEADRLANLAPSTREFDRERNVVLTELALRIRTTPAADLRDAVFEAAHAGSAVAHAVGGNAAALAATTLDDVAAFRRCWLRPRNAVVVIAGAVDTTAALNLVAGTLGHLVDDGGEPAAMAGPATAAPPPAETVTLDRYDTEGFHVCLGFRLPMTSAADRPAVWFAREALRRQGLTTSSQALPAEQFLTASVWYRFPAGDDRVPSAETARSAATDGLASVWTLIDQAEQQLRDAAGFTRIKRSLLRSIEMSARDPEVVADTEGECVLAGWTAVEPAAMADSIAALGKERVLALFDREFVPGKAVVGVLYGRDSGRNARVELPASEQDPAVAEATDPLATVSVAEISTVLDAYAANLKLTVVQRSLANGIPVSVLTIPGSGRAQLSGVVPIPWLASERRGKLRGLIQLYDAVVNEGFRSPEVDGDGRYLPYEPPFDAYYWAAPWILEYGATGPADRMADIGRTLVRRLDDDAFNFAFWGGVLAAAPGAFAIQNSRPADVARTFRWSAHFGDDHPVMGLWCGDETAIARMRYKDVQKRHRELARGCATRLLAVGDIDADSLVAALEPSFGRRHRYEEPPSSVLPPREPGVKGRIVPAFDQHDVSLSLTFPPASTDPPATGIELALLEELVQARLFGRLRSEMGQAYFVAVSTTPVASSVVAEASTSCRAEAGPAVLAGIRAELRALAGQGPDEVEMQRARLAVVQQLVRSLADADAAADCLSALAKAGPLPTEPLAAVNAVTVDRVRELLSAHLPPDDFAFTAVGPIFEDDLADYLRP
jgi:predicted Zn-dependent peptidase